MAKLYAPDQTPIVGTLETIPGTANLGGATRNPDGTFEVEYAGGTDIDWNMQETVVRDGQRVFLDEDGGEWLENELVLRDEEAV